MDVSNLAQMMPNCSQKWFAGKKYVKGLQAFYQLSGPTQMAQEMQADTAKYK
jgi:hypothetical protein